MDLESIFLPTSDAADAPRAGFYSVDRRGKVGLPVRIWFGPPVDLEADNIDWTNPPVLDRSPRWQMAVGDRLVDERTKEQDWDLEWGDVWPQCAGSTIDGAEYRYRLACIADAKASGARNNPWGRRTGRIDKLTAPTLF